MLFEIIALGIAGHLVSKVLKGDSNTEEKESSDNNDSGPDLSYDNNVSDGAKDWGPTGDESWGGSND